MSRLSLSKMMDCLGDGVICVDEKDRIIYANQAASRILGDNIKKKYGLLINTCFDIRTEDSGSIISKLLREIQKSGLPRGLDPNTFLLDELGRRMFLSASLSPVKENGGDYIVINFREITKIKQLELENIEQRKNLETIFNGLPVGVIIVDHSRKVLQVNPFMKKQFFLNNKEDVDVLLGNLLRCVHAKGKVCGFQEACDTCQIKKKIEAMRENPLKASSIKVAYLHDHEGMVIKKHYQIGFANLVSNEKDLVMLMIQDITEQIEYQEKIESARVEAEHANLMKSQFLSNVSHEIRTPLNGIIGMIDLSRRSLEDQEVIDYLDTAKTSSLNLLQIINAVLDISKMEAGKFDLHMSSFNLKRLLEEVYHENKVKTSGTDVTLRLQAYHLQEDFFVSDPLRIKQVLNNLVDNAIKFTEKGTVTLSYRLEQDVSGDKLVLIVTDTGIGMEEKYLAKLYESFSQEDGSFTRKKGGTGLGLAISKNIVTLLNGAIHCESKPREGSRFTVTIPIEIAKEHDLDKKRSTPMTLESKRDKVTGRILVAEDDVINQKVIKKYLEVNGYQVTLASDGKEAIDMYTDNSNYDMILMDIQMPLLSGLDATAQIRKMEKKNRVPIIAMTALALEQEQEIIATYDFDQVLTKPVQLANLSHVINQYLNVNRKKEVQDHLPHNDEISSSHSEEEIVQLISNLEQAVKDGEAAGCLEELDKFLDFIDVQGINKLRYSVLRLKMDLRKHKYDQVLDILAEMKRLLLHDELVDEEDKNVKDLNSGR